MESESPIALNALSVRSKSSSYRGNVVISRQTIISPQQTGTVGSLTLALR